MADTVRAKLERLRQERDADMQREGLAPPDLISLVRPGAVFSARDSAIAFPESRLPGAGARSAHERRRVIVVQAPLLCSSRRPRTLQVVPCTAHSGSPVDPFDFEIPADEEAFTALRVVALASLSQPILKADLVEFHGRLSKPSLFRLLAILARNFDLAAPTAGLPPRP